MNRALRRITVFSLIMAMAFSFGVMPASAASPMIEDIEYCGSGIVEVDFVGDVSYKNTKVTVKDNKGKKYRASIIKKDSDDIKFKIKKYKKGRTYKFKIKNVKSWNGGSYRTVSGKVKINKASKFIGKAKAKKIALKDAGLSASQVWFKKAKLDYDDGRYIYDIEFMHGYTEYGYEIHASTGRILDRDIDWD